MASAQQVYNRLFAGETLTLQFGSRREFETLRTALCKRNAFSVALDMTTDSIIATWHETSLRGVFKLGESERQKNLNKWQIIEPDQPE